MALRSKSTSASDCDAETESNVQHVLRTTRNLCKTTRPSSNEVHDRCVSSGPLTRRHSKGGLRLPSTHPLFSLRPNLTPTAEEGTESDTATESEEDAPLTTTRAIAIPRAERFEPYPRSEILSAPQLSHRVNQSGPSSSSPSTDRQSQRRHRQIKLHPEDFERIREIALSSANLACPVSGCAYVQSVRCLSGMKRHMESHRSRRALVRHVKNEQHPCVAEGGLQQLPNISQEESDCEDEDWTSSQTSREDTDEDDYCGDSNRPPNFEREDTEPALSPRHEATVPSLTDRKSVV